jgi:uncharacterized protein (TIGR02145 family)
MYLKTLLSDHFSINKRFLLTVIALFFTIITLGQNPVIDLTFTAIDNTAYVQLDSIKVMNRTQGNDTVLFYPDTVLVLDYQVGISVNEFGKDRFQVFQNYPNPVADQTTITLYIPEIDKVSILMTDILGRRIIQTEKMLDRGKHTFRLNPGGENIYFFIAQWKGLSSGIKIQQAGFNSNRAAVLEYIGSDAYSPQLKAIKAIRDFSFSPGDNLVCIGYRDTLQSVMLFSPGESTTYSFQFACNIPCPGTPTVEYEGRVYNTIQIFNQCWMKENLNVGSMINGAQNQTNNSVIEKYCYDNDPANCDTFGGLYQWDEAMQYTTIQGVQGICPPGWHLPTDEDWMQLEGVADSQYRYPDPEWYDIGYRGFDVGKNLKSTTSWNSGGNGIDKFGFQAMAAGSRYTNGAFIDMGNYSIFWSSTEIDSDEAWYRILNSDRDESVRYVFAHSIGFSCRCVKD